MADPLDNPVWHALTTTQAALAQAYGSARRYNPEYTALAGFAEPSARGFSDLAELYKVNEIAGITLEAEQPLPRGWDLLRAMPLLQLKHEGPAAAAAGQDFVELGAPDVPEMTALALLTKPGPFAARTRELGTYLGVRRDGRLVAMAGERMRLPGHAEVSAVCTHPQYTGHGYAGVLVAELARRLRAGGEAPFLHVRKDNDRAVKLYQRLGFRISKDYLFVMMRRTA